LGFFGFFFKGLVLGFSIAAPVGPIGLLCIRRSLAEGRLVGLLTGLGAATADAVYGAIAAFGLTAVSGALVAYRTSLGLVGGAFLCYLGLRTLTSKPAQGGASTRSRGLASAYASTFVLTLTNPMTILSFIAIFAGLGLASGSGYTNPAMLVVGVFAGSAAWWLLLSTGTSILRSTIGTPVMTIVNQVSGSLILAFGVYAIATALRR
jgi:threonine/homoserine/homoserine lactone efflux protein